MKTSFGVRFVARATPHPAWWLLLALLVIANGVLAYALSGIDNQLDAARQEREAVRQQLRQQALRQSAGAAQTLPSAVADRLAVPWGLLLDTLAQTTPKNMRIVQLAPDAAYRVLQWSVETDDLAAVANYLQRLDRSGALRNVHMTEQAHPDPGSVGSEPRRAWKITFRGEWVIGATADGAVP